MFKIGLFWGVGLMLGCLVPINAQSSTQNILQKLSQIKQSQPSFNIKLKVDKEKYQLGDPIEFSFRVDRDCYLTLIEVATEGVVRVIYPNKLCPDNFVKAGKNYSIPRDCNFQINLSGPSGIERLKAIATTWKTDIFRMNFQNEEYFFFEGKPDDKVIINGLDNLAKALKNKGTWSETSLDFEVLETAPSKRKKRGLEGKIGQPAPKPTPSTTTTQEHKKDNIKN
jgi:hypothetical protein